MFATRIQDRKRWRSTARAFARSHFICIGKFPYVSLQARLGQVYITDGNIEAFASLDPIGGECIARSQIGWADCRPPGCAPPAGEGMAASKIGRADGDPLTVGPQTVGPQRMIASQFPRSVGLTVGPQIVGSHRAGRSQDPKPMGQSRPHCRPWAAGCSTGSNIRWADCKTPGCRLPECGPQAGERLPRSPIGWETVGSKTVGVQNPLKPFC